MDSFDFALAGVLLFVSSLVAMVTRRLNLPYSTGLVAAGILLALFDVGTGFTLTPQLVFTFLLPPLIFEAAIQIPWRPFRRELPLLFLLVTIGVVLAASVIAMGMHWLIGWSWLGAAFFGVLMAATDPVSVIALFRTVKVDDRLHLLVEAESLLNDGVAAVGFAVLVLVAGGAAVGPVAIGTQLLVSAFGGAACGAAVAGLLLVLAGRTEDRLVEISVTTIAAFGSFLLAEHFHLSGVLAALAAGMLVGNVGRAGPISPASRPAVAYFWEYAAFLANSVVFILIGAQVVRIALVPVLAAAAVAIVLTMVGRAATVYPVSALFRRSRLAVSRGYQHVLWWGGLRGALALALALALPANVAERGAIIAVSFAVVVFSVFVQGLTMAPFVRRLGLLRADADNDAAAVSIG